MAYTDYIRAEMDILAIFFMKTADCMLSMAIGNVEEPPEV